MSGVIPTSMQIEFPTPQRMSANLDLFEKYLGYLDEATDILILGQTLTTQPHGGGLGGAGAAKVQRGVERDIMDSDAKRLAPSISRDLMKPLIDLNFGPPSNPRAYPRLTFSLPEDEDLKVLAETYGVLADHGMPIGVEAIRRRYKIPKPAEAEQLLTPTQRITTRSQEPVGDPTGLDDFDTPDKLPPPKGTDDDDTNSRLAVHALRKGVPHPGSSNIAAEVWAEKLRKDWRAVMDPAMLPILAAIRRCNSFIELQVELDKIAEKQNMKPLVEQVRKALFNATLAGLGDLGLE